MNIRESYVVIDHDLGRLGRDEDTINYVAHVLCTRGEVHVEYNSKGYTLKENGCMIIPLQNLLMGVEPSLDFQGVCVYVSPEMIKAPDAPPDSNDFRGSLAIFHHPVIQLGEGEMDRLLSDVDEIEYRQRHTEMVFHEEALYHAVQIALLDFFNISSKSKEDADVPIQYIDLIVRFMGMLQRGEYIEHRRLDYYANQLSISAKYLSNVMRTYTGCGASYWINRFTMVHLCKLVRDTSMTFSAIADQFGFSSPSHFYKYFQGQLGMSPSEFRGGVKPCTSFIRPCAPLATEPSSSSPRGGRIATKRPSLAPPKRGRTATKKTLSSSP